MNVYYTKLNQKNINSEELFSKLEIVGLTENQF